ncbi:MAG: hypothetical protein QM775_17545 [Pirellulales bacterium]
MIWSLLTVAVLAAPPEFQLGLADGSQVRGTFEAVSADAIVVNAAPGGRREVLTSQLLTVAPAAASEYFVEAATVWVDLIDGTQFWAVSYTTMRGQGDDFLRPRPHAGNPRRLGALGPF